jgi:hypothetical protein
VAAQDLVSCHCQSQDRRIAQLLSHAQIQNYVFVPHCNKLQPKQ